MCGGGATAGWNTHDAGPGSVFLCPAGVHEDMIHLYGEVRESVHLYLPAMPLSATALQ